MLLEFHYDYFAVKIATKRQQRVDPDPNQDVLPSIRSAIRVVLLEFLPGCSRMEFSSLFLPISTFKGNRFSPVYFTTDGTIDGGAGNICAFRFTSHRLTARDDFLGQWLYCRRSGGGIVNDTNCYNWLFSD